MIISSRKTKIWVVVAVFCLAAVILCFMLLSHLPGFPISNRGHSSKEQIAQLTQQTGEMTAQEALRSEDIDLSVTKTGLISDADLDFVLHLAQTSGTGDLIYTQLRHSDSLIALKKLRIFAPGQKEKIYSVASPLLSSGNVNEKAGAMAAIRAIKDKRAIPAVTALLKDSSSVIREQAQNTLTVINS